MYLKSVVIFLASCSWLVLTAPVYSQKTPCQSVPQYQAFDFWLGDWAVSDASGKAQGTNRITKSDDGCLIHEYWTSVQGNEGYSINYFNPVTKLWSQYWASAGSIIEYSGQPDKAGHMRLEGTIYFQQTKTKAPFRGTWTLLKDGRVRQLFEQYDGKTEQWSVWFDGYYTKQEEQR